MEKTLKTNGRVGFQKPWPVVSRVRLSPETAVGVWHNAVAQSSSARAKNDNFTLILYASPSTQLHDDWR